MQHLNAVNENGFLSALILIHIEIQSAVVVDPTSIVKYAVLDYFIRSQKDLLKADLMQKWLSDRFSLYLVGSSFPALPPSRPLNVKSQLLKGYVFLSGNDPAPFVLRFNRKIS